MSTKTLNEEQKVIIAMLTKEEIERTQSQLMDHPIHKEYFLKYLNSLDEIVKIMESGND